MNPSDRTTALSADAHSFIIRTLALLEAELRELALLALADWERLEIVTISLFQAVGALQRPSWGHWNGLLASLAQCAQGSSPHRQRREAGESKERGDAREYSRVPRPPLRRCVARRDAEARGADPNRVAAATLNGRVARAADRAAKPGGALRTRG